MISVSGPLVTGRVIRGMAHYVPSPRPVANETIPTPAGEGTMMRTLGTLGAVLAAAWVGLLRLGFQRVGERGSERNGRGSVVDCSDCCPTLAGFYPMNGGLMGLH